MDALQVVAASTSNDLLTLRAAAAQCHGELLADFGIQEESFAEWLAIERSHLESAMLRLFQKLTEQEAGQARIVSAQRLVVLDPLRETSQRALMQAYADAGENGLALKQFETCQRPSARPARRSACQRKHSTLASDWQVVSNHRP